MKVIKRPYKAALKVIKTIQSCETVEQLRVAHQFWTVFENKCPFSVSDIYEVYKLKEGELNGNG